MKKSILFLSSIMAGALLIGGSFAAFAVTDTADPFGIRITPQELTEDDTDYVTLEWGEATALANVESVQVGTSYKVGVISLRSTINYSGVLTFNMEDSTTSRPSGYKRLIDYLKVYLYEGAQNDVEVGELPSASPLAQTAMGATSLQYNNAVGTAAGKEYSIFITYDSSASPYFAQMQSDVVSLTVDWNPQEADVHEDDKLIYYASNDNSAYLYAWNDTSINAVYPGIQLSKIGKNQYNQNIFKGTLMAGYTKMILSNGGTSFYDKTNDLVVADYDFPEEGLLFWRNEDGSAGYKTFEESDATNYASNLATNPGPILQAWGWTTAKVQSNLTKIKNAGFKAVQLSPMQPVGSGSNTNVGWYMLYQPLGFKVAGNGENPIGTASSLSQLTAAADELGIDIIVDVVANHLAKGNGDGQLYSGVDYYEHTIYSQNLVHNVGNVGDDGDTMRLVRGHVGGLPDLQTENAHVQSRVVSMLKEYIDCGVKGFRFDAAKHIETPADGDYKSDFWPNVISEINKYGIQSYGKAPYSYGEVLGVGTYRQWYGYTDYIDVTDNGIGWNAREKYLASDEGGVISSSSITIGSDESAVLFAETHDNYTHGEGNNYTGNVYGPTINALYGLHASRLGSSAFYVARASSGEYYGNDTKVVINNPMEDYCNSIISAANRLHNDFVGGSEYLSAWGGCAINGVTLNGRYGAYICHLDNASSATVKVAVPGGYLPTGTYRNLVTGATINITNGSEFTVPLTEGVAVLELIS